MSGQWINTQLPDGYFSDPVEIGIQGGITKPSINILYDSKAFPRAFKGISYTTKLGGTKLLAIDKNKYCTAQGDSNTIVNALQYGDALIFHGISSVADAFSVVDSDSNNKIRLSGIPHTSQIVITVTGTPPAGSFTVNFSVGSSPPASFTIILSGGESAVEIRDKIMLTMRASSFAEDWYFFKGVASELFIEGKEPYPDAPLMEILPNSLGISPTLSTDIVVGGLITDWNLDNKVYLAVSKGGYWINTFEFGVNSLQGDPLLESPPAEAMHPAMSGLVTGARSVVVARKRVGTVSLPSSPSKTIEASSTLLINIPPIDHTTYNLMADGSLVKDNKILIYVSYKGQGSLRLHKLFPIEIPEAELDGRLPPQLHTVGGAKCIVKSSHPTDIDKRIVEIEFNEQDLLLVEPAYENYPPDEAPRFIARIGNCLLFIGVGKDEIGVDVSFPDNIEAFNPVWRFWLDSLPIAVASFYDFQGKIIIGTASALWSIDWTGITETEAPVRYFILTKEASPSSPQAMIIIFNTIFLFDRSGVPAKINPQTGEVDFLFGRPVEEHTKLWDKEKVWCGYYPLENIIVFSDGNMGFAYHIPTGRWSSPLQLSENSKEPVTGSMTFQSTLFLCKENMNLYVFDAPSASNPIEWRLSALLAESYELKDLIEVRSLIDINSPSASFSFYTYKDYDFTSPNIAFTTTTTIPRKHYLIRGLTEQLQSQTIHLELRSTAINCRIFSLEGKIWTSIQEKYYE